MPGNAPLLPSLFDKIDWAAQTLGVPPAIVDNELKAFETWENQKNRIRVDMDDGSYRSFSAIVALHYNPYPSDRPYKGGIRMGFQITTPDVIRSLALEMTIKNATLDIPFGGGKSGIILDRPAHEFSPRELRRIIEAVATKFIRDGILAPHKYVAATDMGTTSRHMDAIHVIYGTMVGQPNGTIVTGRSVRYGGMPGRDEATGRGGLIVLKHILARERPELLSRPMDVIVQGTGQVGGHFLRLVAQEGARIVGVNNASGAVYNPSGVALDALTWLDSRTIDPHASLSQVPGEHCTNAELLMKPCDVLAAAAVENSLTKENAPLLSARSVLELANHPTNDEADAILNRRGILVIPDILANAGGVFVSFEEWKQSLEGPSHPIEIRGIEEKVRHDLEDAMLHATDEVIGLKDRYGVTYRDAAWLKGVGKLVDELRYKHGDRWSLT